MECNVTFTNESHSEAHSRARQAPTPPTVKEEGHQEAKEEIEGKT